jgi:hypothetical protein
MFSARFRSASGGREIYLLLGEGSRRYVEEKEFGQQFAAVFS